MSAPTVAQLKAAHKAVQGGLWGPVGNRMVWEPEAPVVVVVGAGGGVGATTFALALAESAEQGRLVECTTPACSGLVEASTAELGTVDRGWRRGTRGQTRLDRAPREAQSPLSVPLPSLAPAGTTLEVLDLGWDISCVEGTDTWMEDALQRAHARVVVATATVPSLRRAELALASCDVPAVVGVSGAPLKKWPRGLRLAMGPHTTDLAEQGLLAEIPQDRGLATDGLTPEPLPQRLLAVAHDSLRILPGRDEGDAA
ncbi:hypothetical protein [Kytococcus sedentarius]|uniref:hypothetical protein n=1 Tax=Kytococcus sedentarius TaxID=1276 RepID=UPI00384BE401